jgi:hypothetical protein
LPKVREIQILPGGNKLDLINASMEYFPLHKDEEGNSLTRGEKYELCLANEIINFL